MLITNARIEQAPVSVRVGANVEAIGHLDASAHEPVYDAKGAWLLPGLHDHHIHLRALAARRSSVDLSHAVLNGLDAHLKAVPGTGWIRGFGYHADRLGELTRWQLDDLVSDRPLRIQHSSGKMWVVNSAAVEAFGITADSHEGVEVVNGAVTGRLFRMDDWLRARTPLDKPDLMPVIDELVSYGITSVTDASYTNDAEAENELTTLRHRSGARFGVRCMGNETLNLGGQLKIMLDEDRLPDLDALQTRVAQAHGQDRGVAFHCVSRTEMLVAMHCLEAVGTHADDRIEHGALIGADMIDGLAQLAVPVVTQPGFLADRGERFRRELAPAQVADLYRYRSLLDADIEVICSSDGPYGPVDPWVCMAAARRRLTDVEAEISPAERVCEIEALSGYLLGDDLRRVRRVEIGEPANLVLVRNSRPVAVWLGGSRV